MKRQHRQHPLAGALDIEDVDFEEADLQEDLLFVPYEANGGIKSHFGRHSFNHSILILSDMPQTKKGSWFLHYREKMDAELIATIEGTVYEIWHVRERIRQMRAKRQPIRLTCADTCAASIVSSIRCAPWRSITASIPQSRTCSSSARTTFSR